MVSEQRGIGGGRGRPGVRYRAHPGAAGGRSYALLSQMLMDLAADTSEVQVRYEASAAGVANRVIVCYKDASIDPVQGPTTTVQWRMPPVNRPEQLMTGVTITGLSYSGNYPLVVMNTSPHWIYANTNFKDGDSVAGLVGYEMDKVDSAYALPAWQSHTILSQSPFTDANGSSGISNSHGDR